MLAVAAAWGTHAWHPRAPALYLVQEPLRDDEVSMQAIQERWKGDVLWIDARIQEQFDAGHVPGALLLNEQKFDEQLFGLPRHAASQHQARHHLLQRREVRGQPSCPRTSQADAAGGERLCAQRRLAGAAKPRANED
jgi:hypothetical protein